jgi:hypothetical protein
VKECADCDRPTLTYRPGLGWAAGECEWYMVRDDVWRSAGMTLSGGCLCLECLERRIGRPLTGADFPARDFRNAPDRRHTPRLAALLEEARAHDRA